MKYFRLLVMADTKLVKEEFVQTLDKFKILPYLIQYDKYDVTVIEIHIKEIV